MKLGLVFVAALPLAIAATACGDLVLPSEPNGDGANGEAGVQSLARDASADVPDVVEPPTMRLVDLRASTPQITEGESVTFRAMVSDAKVGLGDIQSQLTDEQGALYGGFAIDGTFTMTRTLTWDAMNNVRPIVTRAGIGTRTFIATFRARGETASAAVTITLACPIGRPVACGGKCQTSCP